MAFTYFVPIRTSPLAHRGQLMPIVQDTADIMLTAVPNQPRDYTIFPSIRDPDRQAHPA
jgi:hypothetical protein